MSSVVLGEIQVARVVHQPGRRWSELMKPIVRTPSCLHHHQGAAVRPVEITTDGGARRVIGPGEVYDIPPGHDGRVLGDEPVVAVEFTGARGWGKPAELERVVATLLVTDIVGSTALATELGDAAWKALLVRHADRVRVELDRFRGVEIGTTGDGFLAMFDGAARAVRCGDVVRLAARTDRPSRSAPASTRGRSSATARTCGASPSTPRPGSRRSPSRARSSSPNRPPSSSRGPTSRSRTRASTSSRPPGSASRLPSRLTAMSFRLRPGPTRGVRGDAYHRVE